MRIDVSEDGYIELRNVYNPVYLRTDDGEEMNICMRDSGFEFEYMRKKYSAQEGIIKRRVIEKKSLINLILLDLTCDVQSELLRQCKSAGLDDCQTDKLNENILAVFDSPKYLKRFLEEINEL